MEVEPNSPTSSILGHALVKMARIMDWDRLGEVFGETFCPDNGRPAVSTRLMVTLHYLKYTHNLSNEDVVSSWVKILTGST